MCRRYDVYSLCGCRRGIFFKPSDYAACQYAGLDANAYSRVEAVSKNDCWRYIKQLSTGDGTYLFGPDNPQPAANVPWRFTTGAGSLTFSWSARRGLGKKWEILTETCQKRFCEVKVTRWCDCATETEIGRASCRERVS